MIYYGKECTVYGNPQADLYIYCFFHESAKIINLLKNDCFVIMPHLDNWNDALSPWTYDNFKGEGYVLEEWILSTITKEHHYIIAGYSLGGLFSLWMYGRHNCFIGCISCSGSLWYPGWIDYLKTIKRGGIVYLSLGKKESHTKNQIMAKVEENTRRTYEYLSQSNVCIYIEENGGHFHEVDERMIRGFKWLFEKLSIFF